MKVLIREMHDEETAYTIYNHIEVVHSVGSCGITWIGDGNYAPPKACDEIVDITITIKRGSKIERSGTRLVITE